MQEVEGSAEGGAIGAADDGVVAVGAVRVCVEQSQVSVDGTAVTLTPRELAVLSMLVRRPGSVVNKHQLLQQVWKGAVDGHAVEVTIARLRGRLDGLLQIETVPRRGYRLVAPNG